MKSLIIYLSVILIGFLAFSPSVFAGVNIFSQTCGNGSNSIKNTDVCSAVNHQNKSNKDPIISTIKIAVKIISYIIGVAAIIVLIIASIQMIIGGSDPQSVKSARDMMIYAGVGILVAVLAQVIIVFVLNKI